MSYINHCVTPQSLSRTHYWWFMGFSAMPAEAVLESVDRDARHRGYPEFSFVGDAGGVQARRVLQRILVDDET